MPDARPRRAGPGPGSRRPRDGQGGGRRLVPLALTAVFAYGLAIGEAEDRRAADLTLPVAPASPVAGLETGPLSPPFEAGGRCPTNPAYPARTEVVVLAPSPAGYGSIQYPRTPLAPHTVALTFDDGPWPAPRGDQRVFDILEERCIQAVFFHVGTMIEQRPGLVNEAVRRGHGVASHSWSHPLNLSRWSDTAGQAQIHRGFVALNAAASPEIAEPFFRFPGLDDNPRLRAWLHREGIIVVGAEADADDWKQISAAEVHRRAVANLEQTDGGVLILHQIHPRTVEALPGLLDDLNARGYRFVRISGRAPPLPEPVAPQSGR